MFYKMFSDFHSYIAIITFDFNIYFNEFKLQCIFKCTLLLSTEMGRFNVLIYLIIIHRITQTEGRGWWWWQSFTMKKKPQTPSCGSDLIQDRSNSFFLM